MKFIKRFESFEENEYSKLNIKNRLEATPFVENNIRQLIQKMNIDVDDYDDIEDIKSELIEYFTRFPDQISRVSFSTFGVPKNYNLRLNNIGGYVKYR
jgi:curved DNA-binding protein CbpA